jgi:hypothetical protein
MARLGRIGSPPGTAVLAINQLTLLHRSACIGSTKERTGLHHEEGNAQSEEAIGAEAKSAAGPTGQGRNVD